LSESNKKGDDNMNNTRTKHLPHSKFKGYLIENKIQQKEVAKLLNISPVTINQKINGSLHFTFNEVEIICDAYKLMPDIFLTRKLRNDNKEVS
jgi:DNA-binding XRE family transcriptional regulator